MTIINRNGSRQPTPFATTSAARDVWDRVADVYDQGVPFFSVLGRWLVDATDPRPGDAVLDIATGRGACLFPTADRIGVNGHVTGIDLSPAMVALTDAEIAERQITNAAVTTADAQWLPYPDRSFDVVLCSQSVGQFPEPIEALREFHRVLRPGGRLGIQRDTAPDPRWAFTTEILHESTHVEATARTRALDVAALTSQAGFVAIDRFDQPLELVFPDRTAWQDWAWTIGSGRRNLDPLPEHIRREYFDRVFDCMDSVQTEAGYRMVLTIETVIAHR